MANAVEYLIAHHHHHVVVVSILHFISVVVDLKKVAFSALVAARFKEQRNWSV